MKTWTAAILGSVTMIVTALPAQAKDVSIRSADGTRLQSVYLDSPKSTNGVVLIHGENRSVKDWSYLSTKLQRAGFKVLAVDLRKHGANLPDGEPPATLSDGDVPSLIEDVTASLDYLKSKGAIDLAVVGAGLGASLAMEASAPRVDVTNAVLLSPGMRVHGVNLSSAVQAYGERALFMAVGSDDSYASKTALVIETISRGQTRLEILDNAGSGARMLSRAPSLEGLVIAWLVKNRSGFSGVGQETKPTISTEQPDVETVGPALGQ